MPVWNNLYDDEKLALIRKDQENPFVMYFIIKKSLEMSPGKISIQVGHAAQMMVFWYDELKLQDQIILNLEDFNTWKKESFRKVSLVANDKEFEKIKNELYCVVVKDAGLTQVKPGSETVLAIWPMRKNDRPKLLKRLQVLK